MAIVENRASEIGDVILIKAAVPIIGLVTLASFTDSLVGETGSRFFNKEFRYSLDGINFGGWIPLTNPNLVAVDNDPSEVFLIEYRYTRAGSDSFGDLEFNFVEVDGTFQETVDGSVYSKSIFAQFFTSTDVCVLSWMISVLEKLYKDGILPTYMERGEKANEDSDDKDFLEFWKSVTQYFAYIVCYARQWELTSATGNFDILIEYLRNQTFIFCGDEDIEDLVYIMNNTYDEIRHRGTSEITKTKADDGRPVDGEFFRLFCNLNKCTDWYYSLVFNYKVGWVGDSASPLYQGTSFDINLIKGYESTEDVQFLTNYPLDEESYISIVTDGDKDVMQIDAVPDGVGSGVLGVGSPSLQVSHQQFAIPIDPRCDYEITFQVKVEVVEDILIVGAIGWDENFDKVINSFDPVYAGTNKNQFLQDLSLPVVGEFYPVRCIIYGSNYRTQPGDNYTDYIPEIAKLDITPAELDLEADLFGICAAPTPAFDDTAGLALLSGITNDATHLRFKEDTGICYITPTIGINNNTGVDSGYMRLYDIKVRPLRTPYSTGFEQVSNFTKIKVENFNQQYTNDETSIILREFLLPYNSTYHINFLNSCEDTSVDDVLDIIKETDIRLTEPKCNGVKDDDRYLIWLSVGKFELQVFNGTTWDVSGDNSQGKITYVISKQVTYTYESDRWVFSCK